MRASIAAVVAGLTLAGIVSGNDAQSRPTDSDGAQPTASTGGRPGADDSSSALEEITVTAERRPELLQNVPAQIDVFTSEQIAVRGIQDTSDFISEVPNMTFDRADSYHNSWVVVRGIASVTNADFPIAVVVDGVPQVDQKQFNEQLFDIKDIEVLKGPQGTLYGRDALGGAILIESEAPTPHFTASSDVTYGNGGRFDIRAGVSGPLGSDAVGYRFAANYLTLDGLIPNTYRGDHADFIHYDYDLRGSIVAHLPSDWMLTFTGQFGRNSASTNQYSWVQSNNPNQFVDPTFAFYPTDIGMSGGISSKLEGPLSFATLTWISGYNRMSEDSRATLSFSNPVQNPGGLFDLGFQAGQGENLDITSYYQELRLTSPSDQPFRWVGGLSYQYLTKATLTGDFIDPSGDPAEFWDPTLSIDTEDYKWLERSFGGYGQVDYDLRPDLTVTAGLRYDYDQRQQRDLIGGDLLAANYHAVQPKVTLSWRRTDRETYYLTVGTGYRPGGFNPSGDPSHFSSEFLRNFEGGWKTVWLDGRLRINGAAFYDIDHGYQYFDVFNTGTGFAQVNQNIDLVVIKGAELETQWYPLEHWQLFANVGYTDAHIAKLTGVPACEGLSAAQLQNVDLGCHGTYTPYLTPWTGNVGTQYERPITSGLSFVGRAELNLYGRKYWEVNNISVQDPKQYLNLRAGIDGGRWSVWLWGKNVTDTRAYSQYVAANPFGIGLAGIGFLVPPATYGIEARIKTQ